MSDREEYLKLIISGDGKLLGAEFDKQERKARTFGNRVGGIFGDLNRKMMNGIKNIATNPLTIFGGAAGIMYAGKQLIEYKDILSTVGINAGMTDAEIVNLDKTMVNLAYQTGQDRDKMVLAFSDIIDKTGDVQYAIGSMAAAGKSSTGLSAELMDVGRVVSSLKLGFNATAEEVEYYMDVMGRMGNIGSFTFAQQASQAERLFSAGALAGGIQKKNFAEYNAFMQSVKPLFGTPDMAGTAIESIMTQLKSDPKIQKALGFKLFDEKGAIIDFEKTIKAIAKLSPAKRTALFGEYGKAFLAFDTDSGLSQFEKYIQAGQKAGFVSEAFARKQKEAKLQLQQFTTVAKDFASVALSEILQDITKNMYELTSNPEKLREFTSNVTSLAQALGLLSKWLVLKPAEGWIKIFDIIYGDAPDYRVTKDTHRQQMFAKSLWNKLPKDEQDRLSPMVDNRFADNTKYAVLQRWRPDLYESKLPANHYQNVKNDIKIDLMFTESGRMAVKTSGNAAVAVSNRGRM